MLTPGLCISIIHIILIIISFLFCFVLFFAFLWGLRELEKGDFWRVGVNCIAESEKYPSYILPCFYGKGSLPLWGWIFICHSVLLLNLAIALCMWGILLQFVLNCWRGCPCYKSVSAFSHSASELYHLMVARAFGLNITGRVPSIWLPAALCSQLPLMTFKPPGSFSQTHIHCCSIRLVFSWAKAPVLLLLVLYDTEVTQNNRVGQSVLPPL